MGLLATATEKLLGWLHRFLTEVIASVVTTACVAGATTLYLSVGGPGEAPAPAAAPAAAELATIFAPAADKGAPAFVRTVAAAKPVAAAEPRTDVSSAVPPKRPRIAAEGRNAADPLAAPLVVYEAASAFDALPEPLSLDNGASYEPGVIEQRPLPPMPYAAAEPETERTLLGVPVPGVVPTGGEIVDGMRGIGHAVVGLVR